MAGWSDAYLLDAWERSAGLDQVARAVALAGSLSDGVPAPAVAEWPLGRRDAVLFDARERLFGARLAALVRCPACAEMVEFEADAGSIRQDPPDDPGPIELTVDGWHVVFRLPTSGDLVAALSPGATGRDLFGRCLLSVEHRGVPLSADDVPDEVLEQVEAEMDRTDPGADVRLTLHCAACSRDWDEAFDVASFLAVELEAWARTTLREVAGLGRAYGWTEPECLALSPARRQLYLDLAVS